jgi:hypothetical protein
MLIDLHVRSSLSLSQGIEPSALIARARQLGLDALAFTESEDPALAEELPELGRRLGLPVFLGVNVATDRGHLLCYPAELDDPFWYGAGWVAGTGLLPRAEEVVSAFVHRGGAVVAVLSDELFEESAAFAELPAEPSASGERGPGTRRGPSRMSQLARIRGLAGLEVLNGRRGQVSLPALRAAEALRLAAVGGSDVESSLDTLGTAATLVRGPVRLQRHLPEALRQGDLWPVSLDGRVQASLSGG